MRLSKIQVGGKTLINTRLKLGIDAAGNITILQ